MILLTGETYSGKRTILTELKKYGFKEVVKYTTNTSYIDNKKYIYITKESFEEKIKLGFFVEYSVDSNGIYYGTSKEDYKENSVLIVRPNTMRTLKTKIKDINIVTVYVKTTKHRRLERLSKREDIPVTNIFETIIKEQGEYFNIDNETDVVVYNQEKEDIERSCRIIEIASENLLWKEVSNIE